MEKAAKMCMKRTFLYKHIFWMTMELNTLTRYFYTDTNSNMRFLQNMWLLALYSHVCTLLSLHLYVGVCVFVCLCGCFLFHNAESLNCFLFGVVLESLSFYLVSMSLSVFFSAFCERMSVVPLEKLNGIRIFFIDIEPLHWHWCRRCQTEQACADDDVATVWKIKVDFSPSFYLCTMYNTFSRL